MYFSSSKFKHAKITTSSPELATACEHLAFRINSRIVSMAQGSNENQTRRSPGGQGADPKLFDY